MASGRPGTLARAMRIPWGKRFAVLAASLSLSSYLWWTALGTPEPRVPIPPPQAVGRPAEPPVIHLPAVEKPAVGRASAPARRVRPAARVAQKPAPAHAPVSSRAKPKVTAPKPAPTKPKPTPAKSTPAKPTPTKPKAAPTPAPTTPPTTPSAPSLPTSNPAGSEPAPTARPTPKPAPTPVQTPIATPTPTPPAPTPVAPAPEQRPGWGHGDQNHEHTGPPGLKDKGKGGGKKK
jgi:hypothetical protein